MAQCAALGAVGVAALARARYLTMANPNISVTDLSSNPDFDFLSKLSQSNTETDEHDFLDTNDIDSPYSQQKFNCNYYAESDFVQHFANNTSLSIMSLNIQSLASKYNDLCEFIEVCRTSNCLPDIICLQELWHINDSNIFSLAGYQPLLYQARIMSQGGGVGIYLRDNITGVVNFKPVFIEKVFESIFVDVNIPGQKKLIIGSIYKPNSQYCNLTISEQNEVFLDNLNNILEYTTNQSADVVIAGDFNIDVLKYSVCNLATTYIDTLFSNGYLQLFTKPTRVSGNHASCIDHFISNINLPVYDTCAVLSKMSDHFPIFLFLNKSKNSPPSSNILKRDFSQRNIELFKQKLVICEWDDICNIDDTERAYNAFHTKFFNLYNDNFPERAIRFNKNFHKKEPWITAGILVSRRTKNRLAKESFVNPSETNRNNFKQYRNIYNRVIRDAKKAYFHSELIANKNNLKKSWQLLNLALNKKGGKNGISNVISNGEVLSDPLKMANAFNSFFTSIASDCVSVINPCPVEDDLPPPVPEHLHFKMSSFPVQQAELVTAVNNLLPKNSLDLNNLSMSLLKQIIHYIEKPVLHVFNKSIVTGVVPSKLKIAKVVPIFKSGNPQDMNNYRPISLISNFAKILEKIVYARLADFLTDKNIITPQQFGFRRAHSTIHPMSLLLNKIGAALNEKKHSIVIFCDLKKAFDTCNIEILIGKLQKIGIHGTELLWFRDYLTNRKQFVQIGSVVGDLLDVLIGVPQGSILGPILFLLYINDLPGASNLISLLFADDTALLDSDSDINILVNRVNTEFRKICSFFRKNKLLLHPEKTKFMVFSNSPAVIQSNFDIVIDNNNPNQDLASNVHRLTRVKNSDKVPAIKYLGVYFDPNLSFKYHIDHVNLKLSKALYGLRSVKNILPVKSLIVLYYSLFNSHLLYANEIWTCTSESNLKSIFVKQKQALKIVTNSKNHAHSEPLFKLNSILPFKTLIEFCKVKFMFDVTQKLSPVSLHGSFMRNVEYRRIVNDNNNDDHLDHPLRNDDLYFVPFSRLDQVSMFLHYNLPRIWNNLPPEITTIENRILFHKSLKKYYLNQLSETPVCNRLLCPACHLP